MEELIENACNKILKEYNMINKEDLSEAGKSFLKNMFDINMDVIKTALPDTSQKTIDDIVNKFMQEIRISKDI